MFYFRLRCVFMLFTTLMLLIRLYLMNFVTKSKTKTKQNMSAGCLLDVLQFIGILPIFTFLFR
jgi:hypothetical protein